MKLTTLCYIEQDGRYLMLHRVKKKADINAGKWIGVGGHFEEGESPEECLLREVREETGLLLTRYAFRGIITFLSDAQEAEYMCLYTADAFTGSLRDCAEGDLQWIPKEEIGALNLWGGDQLFLQKLREGAPFFSMKLRYAGDSLCEAWLDGRQLPLDDPRG